MDVVDGNCVLCTKNTVVLNTTYCNQFRALLKTHYFEVHDEDFKQFSKLFDSRSKEVHSFCVPCAFKINCYILPRNACNPANKTGRTCSFCNNTDYITKCTKQLNDDFELVFKGIKNATRNLNYACLRCLLSVNAFNDINESITKLLNSIDTEPADSASDDSKNMKKSKSPKVIATPQSLRKRKNDNVNKNNSPKRFKQDKFRKSFEEVQKSKKSTKNSKALEKKLKHLNNVNAETIDTAMNLSYQVVTDQKLMFDIPFVDCNSIETESAKFDGKSSHLKAKKMKMSENVIDVSSEDENEETTKRNRFRRLSARNSKSPGLQRISNSGASGNDSETITATSSSRSKRSASQKSVASPPKMQVISKKVLVIESSGDEADANQKKNSPQKNVAKSSPRISNRSTKAPVVAKPVFKTPKIKIKGPIKIKKQEKPKYPCNKCKRVLKMKYMVILHELEHGSSYSPVISVEKRDLLALKENLKMVSKSDEKGVEVASELETDATEKTDIETKADHVDAEENEDSSSVSLRLEETKENEDEKDATEEISKDDVTAEKAAPSEVTEKPDEENDKMDVSTEKDSMETDKEADTSNEKLKEMVNLTSDKEEGSSDELVKSQKEGGKDKSPKKHHSKDDLNEVETENTDVNKVTSDTEDDAVVESSKDTTEETQETEETSTQETEETSTQETEETSTQETEETSTQKTGETSTQETEETSKQKTEENEVIEKSDEDCSEKLTRSPKKKEKTPSPNKKEKTPSPNKKGKTPSPNKKEKTPSPKKSDKGESPKDLDVEPEKQTTMEVDTSSDNDETTTSKVAKSPETPENEEKPPNDEEKLKSPKKTDTASPKKPDTTSPKKPDTTSSPKKQKESKETDDKTNKQEKDTTMEVDDDAPNKDVKSPKKSSKSPSPKRAKSASPKKVAETSENKDEDSEDQTTKKSKTTEESKKTTSDVTDIFGEPEKEETPKDIPKEGDKNLSPISSDNESNTEPNDNASKNSDFSDNENERSANKEQKSNGFVDCEMEEFTLKLSSSEESNSPDKKNTSNQENESTNIISEETANSVRKAVDQDTFQIVENILQNLGA